MQKIYFFIFILFISANSFGQTLMWRMLSSPQNSGRADDLYFINAYTGWVIDARKIMKTRDGGWTWIIQKDTSAGGFYFRSIGFLDSLNGFAGTLDTNRFLWRTTNGGNNWFVVQNVPQPQPKGICGISVVNSSVIYGCGNYYRVPTVIKSTDAGNSWQSINMSPYSSTLIDCYFNTPDSGIVVGGIGSTFGNRKGIVLFTSNGGVSWVNKITSSDSGTWGWKISFPSKNVGYVSLEKFGSPTFFFKTTDGGITWEQKLFLNIFYNEEAIGFVNDTLGWIGGESNTSYETTNGGVTWYPKRFAPTGFPDFLNRIRFINDTIGFASGARIFKYTWEETIGINSNQNNLPSSFMLMQNYPNPFNPSTTIKYYMPLQATVKITIFDVLGREVYVFENGLRPPGEYSFKWEGTDKNGTQVTSGVYFYRIETDNYTETKKMILVK